MKKILFIAAYISITVAGFAQANVLPAKKQTSDIVITMPRCIQVPDRYWKV